MKSFLALTLLLPSLSIAHISMASPVPLNGKSDTNIDPLSTDAQYPCQGYIPQYPFKKAAAQYTAGDNASITLSGTATHNGGSCQFSLSYDNGSTFRVIKSIIGGCPLPLHYDVKIPSIAPAGNALFAWTWYNKVGNREIYMNCAWVTINSPSLSPTAGGSGTSSGTKLKARSEVSESYYGTLSARKRKQANSHRVLPRTAATTTFNGLPLIFQANLPRFSHVTLSGCDVHFPDPGPVVVTGISKYAWCYDDKTGYDKINIADTSDDAGGIAASSVVLPATPTLGKYTLPGTAPLGSNAAGSSLHPTTSSQRIPATSPTSSSSGGQGAACSPQGAFACDGPSQFYTCDYGSEVENVNGVPVEYPLVWTEVRPVAPGMSCVGGEGSGGVGAGFVAARRDVSWVL